MALFLAARPDGHGKNQRVPVTLPTMPDCLRERLHPLHRQSMLASDGGGANDQGEFLQDARLACLIKVLTCLKSA